MKKYRLELIGFGNVGQALARLLLRKGKVLGDEFNLEFIVTGIATGRHGSVIDPGGIDLDQALAEASAGVSGSLFGKAHAKTLDFISACSADALLENSPVNHQTGEPAAEHLRAALRLGMHAITANKGPVVFAHRELTRLASEKGKRFLFESAVMDGAPIFSLFRETLPAAELRGFTGILNSCTNFILGLHGAGRNPGGSYQKSPVHRHRRDRPHRRPGWLGCRGEGGCAVQCADGRGDHSLDIPRVGIRSLSAEEIRSARRRGERWKLICRANREGGTLVTSIRPEVIDSTSPFFTVEGTSSMVKFETDVLPGLGILEMNPSPETTAFGLLADLIQAFKEN